jgi:PAS domain S-box-containing protein
MTPEKTDARSTAPQSNFEALAEEQRSLAEIGRIVSSTLNLDEALSAFVEQTRPLVPFDRIVINIVSDDLTEFRDVYVDDARPDAPPDRDYLPYNSTTLAREALENQAEFVANGRDYQTYLEQVHPEQKQKNISGFNSLLLIPLIWQGKAIGTLNLRSTEAEAYSDPVIELAHQIGAQIAGAIASFKQRTAIEKELLDRQELADEQTRIAEIGRIVASTLNIEEVFDAFAEQAQHLVPWDRLIVAAISKDRSHLIDRYIAGIDVNGRRPPLGALERDEVFDRIFTKKKQFVELNQIPSTDLPAGIRRDSALKVGLKSMLVTPLLWKGDVAGVLTFRSTDQDAYDDHHADLALQIAQQIAGHIATADEYALLERESSERRQLAEEQRRIAEIGRLVSSTLVIDEVFDSVAEQVRRLVPFDRIVIGSVSEDRTELIHQFVAGLQAEASGPGDRIPQVKNEVYQCVFIEKKPFLGVQKTMRDYLATTPVEQPRTDAGLKSMLVTPLLWKGEVEGVLTFRSFQDDAYGEHEVDLALQISQQIAGAIATADQYAIVERESEERQRLAEEQSRIAEIGRIVSSTLDVQEVLAAFVEQARELVPIDRIVITEVDDEMTTVTDIHKAGIGVDPDQPPTSYPFLHTPIQANVMSTQTTYVANGKRYDKYVENEVFEAQRQEEGIRAILIVPLVWQGRCFGTMNLRSIDPEAYDDREIELSEQIGAQVAGAISTSNQYAITGQESQERQRLAEEQSRIAEIGRIVSSSLDIQEVLEGFVDHARALVPFDRIVVTSVNDDLTMWISELAVGIGIDPEKIGVPQPINSSSYQKKVVSEQWKFAANGEEYRQYTTRNPRELELYNAGIRSIILIPLVWQGRCFGSMNLRSTNPDAYGEHEVELTEQIGAQIAGAFATSSHVRSLEAAATAAQTQVAALEAAGDAIVIRGLDTSIEYINKAYEKQTGYTLEEIGGPNPQYQAVVSIGSDFIDEMWAQVRSGQSVQATFVGTHRDGTEREYDATLSPIFDKENKIIKFVGIRRDVTERVRAEDDIRTQAAALNAAGDSVVILNPDTSIEWVNEAFLRDSEYSKEEVIGRRSPFMRSDKDSSDVFDGLWEQVLGGKPWSGRMWVRPKTRDDYQVDTSLTPVLDDHGNVTRIVGIRRDITEIIQAENDREATRDLDAQNQQLLQLNEQREEFFSTVSHELRTPLTAVMAFADILTRNRDGSLSNLQLEHLDVIKRNSKNLNALIEDMLDFSQLSTDRLKLEKSEFEIHSLIESIVESLEPTANQRGQSLAIEPHTSPVWITADAGRISQVISNLITNSCKYSPTSTRITLAVELGDKEAVITVTDQGYGIPESDLEQIFSPFFRADQTAIREEIGTGLGLAISKTLIDLHGGSIEATSTLGEGTEMTITLPGATAAPTNVAGS